MTVHNPDLIARMVRARDMIIRDDLLAERHDNTPDLNDALVALAAKYDAGDLDRAREWKLVADLAYRAYRAYRAYLADLAYLDYLAYLADLADRADLADLADRADRAYLADLADRADLAYLDYLAYLADRADKLLAHMAPFLAAMPDLDARVWGAIKDDPERAHDQDGWETTCGTTYCRGGWAVTFQPHAAELVKVFGWASVAMAVYRLSTGEVPDFWNTDNAAALDMDKVTALVEAVEDVTHGRGMFGADATADLDWALLHLEKALAAFGGAA